jgi:hypothetical protein
MYETIIGIVLSAVLAFISWLTVKTISLETEIAKINAIIHSKEKDCDAHHRWMETQDESIAAIRDDVSFIRGRLEGHM